MTDANDILRRQAEWQRAQSNLPWALKVRLAEALRESIAQLRLRSAAPGSAEPQSRARDRSHMTARVVPLDSDEAGDARVEGSASQRLAILADLSRRMWELTRCPYTTYSRATMPGRITTLSEQ